MFDLRSDLNRRGLTPGASSSLQTKLPITTLEKDPCEEVDLAIPADPVRCGVQPLHSVLQLTRRARGRTSKLSDFPRVGVGGLGQLLTKLAVPGVTIGNRLRRVSGLKPLVAAIHEGQINGWRTRVRHLIAAPREGQHESRHDSGPADGRSPHSGHSIRSKKSRTVWLASRSWLQPYRLNPVPGQQCPTPVPTQCVVSTSAAQSV